MKILLFILLLLFVWVIFYFNNKIKKIRKGKYEELGKECQAKVNEIEEKQKIIEQKEGDLHDINQEFFRLRALNDGLKEQIKEKNYEINTVLKEQQGRIDEIVEDKKRLALERMEIEILSERKQRIERVDNEVIDILNQYSEKINDLIIARDEVRAEVNDMEAKRNAMIEAFKREQELEEQETYHKIALDSNTIEDIDFIRQTLDKMHCKNIVAKVVWEELLQTPTKEMLDRVVGKEKVSGVYRIAHIPSKRSYIGQAADIRARLTQHVKGTLGIQSIADQRVHHAMAETGIQNWTFEVLELCEKEMLNSREKYYIGLYESNVYGYNQTKGNK